MIFSSAKIADFLTSNKSKVDIFPLREWHGQPGVILRHDVDLDLAPAHALARLEAEVGVLSTFFILVTAHTYNPASQKNRALLRQMVELGFEIGLHFDPMIYGSLGADALASAVRREAKFLSEIVGANVESVSLHNASLQKKYYLFDGWKNAYDPRIFAPDVYLSDSGMIFRSDPTAFVEKAKEKTIQLLLHPLHYSEDGQGYSGAMIYYFENMIADVDKIFSVNSGYLEVAGDGLFRMLMHAFRSRNERT